MAGKITALELQKHNRERVNIFLDDEFAFGLTLIEAAQLHKGQSLTDAEIAALTAKDAIEQAYQRAVRLLAARPYSIAEVRRHLARRQPDAEAHADSPVTDSVLDTVIERLESRGYVDDAAFARFWVANRDQFRPKGGLALRAELREKGISDAIITEVLSEVEMTDSAYRAAQGQVRKLRGTDPQTFRRKLSAFLIRRGFDYDTVAQVIQRLIEEIREQGDDPSHP